MKLRTRLLVTFSAIILLPLILTVLAFWLISSIISKNAQLNYGLNKGNYTIIAETMDELNEKTEDIYQQLWDMADQNDTQLEDVTYLEDITNTLGNGNVYLLVRKNLGLYYTGNPEAADVIFDRLPLYGQVCPNKDTAYYYNDLQKRIV